MASEALAAPIARPLTVAKNRVDERFDTDESLTRLVYSYLATSAVWLLVGTLIGSYLSLKFVWPDLGVAAGLSFGRLRPIHVNTVFWGFASPGMLGLALWVVPRTCRSPLASPRLAWIALVLINLSVTAGALQLGFGITNGAGEFREFTWPVMAIFATALILLAVTLYRTIARRATAEIYISNWYILAALLWTIVLVAIAYVPWIRGGLADTVVQGYYMHQGVGMWFTPMSLGLTYYFLPKLLNKPIYSYSLGVLAFWTQLLFYTMIGAHHFVFSATPWLLQTVAIIFSVGMLVPVVAGTGNFLLTIRGSTRSFARSYSLPFIMVGVFLYFVGSMQGTFEALRSLNQLWHFTDVTVGHAHLTMYGFVAFLLWGGVYALVPRLSGHEPSHGAIGLHFWLSVVGLSIYVGALSIGGTLRGLSWMSGAPFIESVTLMVPFWLARAVGGSLMLAAHFVFAWNLWQMRPTSRLASHAVLSERALEASVA